MGTSIAGVSIILDHISNVGQGGRAEALLWLSQICTLKQNYDNQKIKRKKEAESW